MFKLGWGGGGGGGEIPPPQLSLLFVDPSQRNFAQRLTINLNMENIHKINDVIDSDAIILRSLPKTQ